MTKRFISTLLLAVLVAVGVKAQLIAPGPEFKSSVSPMLTTIWGQGSPYNNQCPTWVDKNGVQQHCPVGCVALALGQIMKYWDYPVTGQGSKSYWFMVSVSADFGATTYQWANMRNAYLDGYSDEEVAAVATLLYHCGAAVGMMYALTGSSAMVSAYTARGMVDYFRYSSTAQYLSRQNYSKEEWMKLIYKELSEGRPVFYAGNSPTQGSHAWVLDGYNSAGEVHINWGWKGGGNGYYDIDLTDTENDFNQQQSMIIGIMPSTVAGIAPVVGPTEKTVVGIYSLDGIRLAQPQKGINIYRYSDGSTQKIILH